MCPSCAGAGLGSVFSLGCISSADCVLRMPSVAAPTSASRPDAMASAGSVCVDSRGIETRREEEVTRARAVRHAGERCVLVRDGTLPVVRGAATVPILVMERACGSGVRSLSTTTHGTRTTVQPTIILPSYRQVIPRKKSAHRWRKVSQAHLRQSRFPVYSMRDSLGIPPVSKFSSAWFASRRSFCHTPTLWNRFFWQRIVGNRKKHGFWRGKSSTFENY